MAAKAALPVISGCWTFAISTIRQRQQQSRRTSCLLSTARSKSQINFRLNRKYQAHAGLDLGELEGVLEARGQAVALFVAAGDVLQAVVPKNGRAFAFTAVQRATYEIKANRMVTTQKEGL
jgi:hypothetical protein